MQSSPTRTSGTSTKTSGSSAGGRPIALPPVSASCALLPPPLPSLSLSVCSRSELALSRSSISSLSWSVPEPRFDPPPDPLPDELRDRLERLDPPEPERLDPPEPERLVVGDL